MKEFRQEYEAREQQRQVAEASARDRDAAEKVDPRLNDDPEFGKYIAGKVLTNPDYRSGNINAVVATQKAVEDFDKYISQEAAKRNEELVNKASQHHLE